MLISAYTTARRFCRLVGGILCLVYNHLLFIRVCQHSLLTNLVLRGCLDSERAVMPASRFVLGVILKNGKNSVSILNVIYVSLSRLSVVIPFRQIHEHIALSLRL